VIYLIKILIQRLNDIENLILIILSFGIGAENKKRTDTLYLFQNIMLQMILNVFGKKKLKVVYLLIEKVEAIKIVLKDYLLFNLNKL